MKVQEDIVKHGRIPGPTLNPSAHSKPSKLHPPFRTFQCPSSGGSSGDDNTTTIVESTWTFKSQSGRAGVMTNPAAGPPQPHSTPRPHSPLLNYDPLAAQICRDHRLVPMNAIENTSGAGPDKMRHQIAQLVVQNEDLCAQREYRARVIERLESNEIRRMQLVRGVGEWVKSGESLLGGLADALGDGVVFC